MITLYSKTLLLKNSCQPGEVKVSLNERNRNGKPGGDSQRGNPKTGKPKIDGGSVANQ